MDIFSTTAKMFIPQQKKYHYKIKGIDLEFPYELYDTQEKLVTSIITSLQNSHNGLFHSPTGTGKTLCFLISVLAYMGHHPEENIRFLYCTRTHSQMNSIIKELQKTNYLPQTCMMGSRDVLCLNKDLNHLNGEMKNLYCSNIRHGCPYYTNFKNNRKQIEQNIEEITDLEDLYELAKNFEQIKSDKKMRLNTSKEEGKYDSLNKKTGFCPYYFCKSKLKNAKLIILTYNYLLDPKIRESFDPMLRNAVVLFDEAHNIEEICEDLLSFKIKDQDLSNILNVFQKIYNDNSRKERKILKENPINQEFGIPKGFLKDLEYIMNEIEIFRQHIKDAIPKNSSLKIFEQDELKFFLLNEFIFSSEILMNRNKSEALSFSNQIKKEQKLILKFINIIGKISILKKLLQNNSKLAQTYFLTLEVGTKYFNKDNEIIISLYCFDPTLSFSNILNQNIKCLFLTSGTLKPFELYESRMRIPFQTKYENSHVVNTKRNLVSSIIQSGFYNYNFNFSMSERSNKKMIVDLGESLLRVFEEIPNGKLVFFTSFSFLQEVLVLWEKPEGNRIIKRMEEKMAVFIEEKSRKKTFYIDKDEISEDENDYEGKEEDRKKIYKNYFNAASKPKGAVLFGVLRGKGSEGVDFSDEAARGVFIIGIPFLLSPNIDIKTNLKMKYIDRIQSRNPEKSISGQYWYDIQAVKSINQGIGRVIRHKNDYGVIGLFDCRFRQKPNIINNLSDWAREVLSEDNFDVFKLKVSQFFKGKNNEKKKNQEIHEIRKNEIGKKQDGEGFLSIINQADLSNDLFLADKNLDDILLEIAIEESLIY